jgi:acyl-ACP thioesterase
MNEAMTVLEKTEQVSSYECDFEQQARPVAFFQHLAEIAGEHAGVLGFGFDDLIARNYYWVESRLKIKFFDFPHFHDQVIVRTWPKTIQQKLFFIRDFEILSADGKRIAAASSAWLIIDATSRRMVPTAAAKLDLPASPDMHGLDEPLDKIGLHGAGTEQLRVKAGYSAVDMQGHVNNSRYVEWICDCFPLEMYRTHRLDWIQINYDHEILPGEEVSLLVDQTDLKDGLYTVEGLNRSNQTRSFECALHWNKI